MSYKNLFLIIGSITLSSLLATLSLIAFDFEGLAAFKYFVPSIVLFALWGMVFVANRAHPLADKTADERRQFSRVVLIPAALLIAASAFLVLSAINPMDVEIGKRILGVAAGIVMVFLGNSAPKTLPSPGTMKVENISPKQAQSLQRVNGFVLVIAGVLCVLVSIFLEVSLAMKVASILGLLAAGISISHRIIVVAANSRRASD